MAFIFYSGRASVEVELSSKGVFDMFETLSGALAPLLTSMVVAASLNAQPLWEDSAEYGALCKSSMEANRLLDLATTRSISVARASVQGTRQRIQCMPAVVPTMEGELIDKSVIHYGGHAYWFRFFLIYNERGSIIHLQEYR